MKRISNQLYKKYFIAALFFLFAAIISFAQQNDSVKTAGQIHAAIKKEIKDTTAKKIHSPKIASIRSAVLPGWGQIYNKKYWKLPIVYGLLGTFAGIFIYNLNNYRDTRFAYHVKYNMRVYHTDSSLYAQIKDNLKPLSEESLRFYRNQYRRDVDYSALYFLICWGLNVVDAAVDAHLQSFDVSPNLSLKIKPGHSEMAGTNGLSLVFSFK